MSPFHHLRCHSYVSPVSVVSTTGIVPLIMLDSRLRCLVQGSSSHSHSHNIGNCNVVADAVDEVSGTSRRQRRFR